MLTGQLAIRWQAKRISKGEESGEENGEYPSERMMERERNASKSVHRRGRAFKHLLVGEVKLAMNSWSSKGLGRVLAGWR